MSDLEIEIREKRFPAVGEAAAQFVLRDLRLTARHGEFVCVIGPSGCGKTTLLNIIAGLDHEYDGRMRLPAVPGRSHPVVGYVFQNPRLLPWHTVIENIELVLTPEQRRSGLVDELLAVTRLDEVRDVYPQRLSLGMSRRVSLVRAFAVQPDLLLMDEPFVSLDEPTAQRLRALLLAIWRDRPTTVLFVSHNLREAIFLADRIVVLSGAPTTVLADVPVDLARTGGRGATELETFRTALVKAHPGLVEGL